MQIELHSQFDTRLVQSVVDVSIVMPCLNEELSLPHCIANARDALDQIAIELGLSGEIVIADNGSTDRSIAIAEAAGARVVRVVEPGYGAALIGGAMGAAGRFIVMGDADGSYDFRESVAMVSRLASGADLCMGSRFKGGIAPGAMPWKNRHIGNPALTGVLNLFFRSGIGDAHCGLRAITRAAFLSLNLSSGGMEFASEMVVKASLKRLRIAEVPATLAVDLRDRPPHLRPWRDGWRHLRYLIMLSPTWAFGVPSLFAICLASAIFLIAGLHDAGVLNGPSYFGASWTIVAGFLFTTGHFAGLMAVAAHLHGVHEGHRPVRRTMRWMARFLTLESLLGLGAVLITMAFGLFGIVAYNWSAGNFTALSTALPLVCAATIGTVGFQTVFGAFILAIIGGHKADFATHILVRKATADSARASLA